MKNLGVFFIFTILGIALILVYFSRSEVPAKTALVTTSTSSTQSQTSFDPSQPPKTSLKGQITTLTGLVKWQSRIATDSAVITSPQAVQQGEQLETGPKAKVNFAFSQVAQISMSENTIINLAQTLPVDLVFIQSKGVANYQKIGQDRVSIRSAHLLIEPESEVSVNMNEDQPIITVTATKGPVTIAFNDSDQISQVKTLKAGQTLIFNDTKLTAKIS